MVRKIKQAGKSLLAISMFFSTSALADKTINTQMIKKPSVVNKRDAHCLAQVIYFEAKNQPLEGQVAVGVTTLNRTRHADYPGSICGVVYHKIRVGSKTHCQYSWVCQRRLKLPTADDELWITSRQIARELVSGNYAHWQKKYSKSLFFHAAYVDPRWRKSKISRVGQHIFYQ